MRTNLPFLIRVSVLKENDEAIKTLLANELSKSLDTAPGNVLSFAARTPTEDEVIHLQNACREAAQTVYESTGKVPSVERIDYGKDGTGQVVWRFAPRRVPPITEAAE